MRVANQLTTRESRFVDYYLASWNAVEAARQAGYKWPEKLGSAVQHRPLVQAALAERTKAVRAEGDEVIARLSQQARVNPSDFFVFEDKELKDTNGQPITRRVMSGINWAMVQQYGYLIKKITYNRQNVPMIEFHDPQKALELLGRAAGLFVDKLALTDPTGQEAYGNNGLISKLLPEIAADGAEETPGEPDPHGNEPAAIRLGLLGETQPDATGRGLADLADIGGSGIRQDPDGSGDSQDLGT